MHARTFLSSRNTSFYAGRFGVYYFGNKYLISIKFEKILFSNHFKNNTHIRYKTNFRVFK